MIRLTRTDRPQQISITLDGPLAGESVPAVESFCRQVLADGKSVVLFLRDVPDIDERGRALLRQLASAGIRLLASGVYTSYIVAGLNRTTHRA